MWSLLDSMFWRPSRGSTRMMRAVVVVCSGALLAAFTLGASAQTIDIRQWRGVTAMTRHPEQVFAGTTAEWRSLWSRVGVAAPDMFEPGRMSAVGIFLGARPGSGYSVNIISASRRHDRIMVVFEERAPEAIMMAERMPAAPRPVAGSSGFVAGSSAAFAPPSAAASLAAPPPHSMGPPTSPWAIVLINRADLPITVEQRLFR